MPLLGVCLGHQGLDLGARRQGDRGARGDARRISASCTRTRRCSPGSRASFQAVRYHSLCVEQPLSRGSSSRSRGPATACDGGRPSHAPAVGRAVPSRVDLHRVRPTAARRTSATSPSSSRVTAMATGLARRAARPAARRPRRRQAPPGRRAKLRAEGQAARQLYDTERAFVNLYGDGETAFWLDSSKVRRARPLLVHGGRRRAAGGDDHLRRQQRRAARGARRADAEILDESIFDYLSREMRRLRYLSHDLPFDFNCGFVGYFGYELKADAKATMRIARRCPTRRSCSPIA